MGRMLNLLDALIARARHRHRLGRSRDALPSLRRLLRQPDLPAELAVESHRLLGEVYFTLHDYRRARRHFAAVLRLRSDDAAAHHRLADAIQADPAVDASRASRHYRAAMKLAPENARIVADCGAFTAEMGHTERGLKLLRRAVELAPGDLGVVRRLIDALAEAGRDEEAGRELAVARFRHGRDPLFHSIHDEFEYRQARERQRQASHAAPKSVAPAVLPFLRVIAADGQPRPKHFVRRDAASGQRPHFPRPARRTDSSQVP